MTSEIASFYLRKEHHPCWQLGRNEFPRQVSRRFCMHCSPPLEGEREGKRFSSFCLQWFVSTTTQASYNAIEWKFVESLNGLLLVNDKPIEQK